MGPSREARPSENTFNLIYSLVKHLTVAVWHPLPETAIGTIDEMISSLVKLKDQIKQENNPNKTMKGGEEK